MVYRNVPFPRITYMFTKKVSFQLSWRASSPFCIYVSCLKSFCSIYVSQMALVTTKAEIVWGIRGQLIRKHLPFNATRAQNWKKEFPRSTNESNGSFGNNCSLIFYSTSEPYFSLSSSRTKSSFVQYKSHGSKWHSHMLCKRSSGLKIVETNTKTNSTGSQDCKLRTSETNFFYLT